MGSSLGLMFRALVMLACLAAVPLVAMYGKYVPDFAQAVMEAYKSRMQAKQAADPGAVGGEAPPFAGSTPRTSVGPGSSPSPAVGDLGQGARPLSDWQQPAHSDPNGQTASLQRASFNAPLGGQTAATAGDASRGGNAPLAAPVNAGAPRGGDPPGTAGAPDCTAQFRRMEQRLRDLGATYYLLETFGSSGDQYRFFCKMAIAGSGENNDNRKFQATAADPLRAMQSVLDQVEQWHAGRQP